MMSEPVRFLYDLGSCTAANCE